MTTPTVDPAELRLSYGDLPADLPAKVGLEHLRSQDPDDSRNSFCIVGAVRVEWDSPRGTFVVLVPTDNPKTPDILEELRPLYAAEVERQYAATE